MSYNRHFTIDDHGQAGFAFDEADVIGEGGAATSRSTCAALAQTIVAVDGAALVARGGY